MCIAYSNAISEAISKDYARNYACVFGICGNHARGVIVSTQKFAAELNCIAVNFPSCEFHSCVGRVKRELCMRSDFN